MRDKQLCDYFASYAALHESTAELCTRSWEVVMDQERRRALLCLSAVHNWIAWAFRAAAATGKADALDELSDAVLAWFGGERVASAADAPDLLAGDGNAN